MMVRGRVRKAAEHDALDFVWRGRDLRQHGGDRDPRRTVRRKPVDAGRDRRKRDRAQAVRGRERERLAIAGCEQCILVMVAPAPDRANRVNDVFRRQSLAARDLGRSGRAAAEASWAAAETCVQTHGGFGFAEEFDIERKFRETRLYQVAPISTNLILSYLAEHVLDLPRSY